MNKQILRLAVPNIISNITVPLLGMVDLAIVGHLSDVLYIDAIAVGTMIFNFLYWNFGFLRMGTSGFAAQAFGARNIAETMYVLARSLAVACFIAFAIIVFQKPIANISLDLVDGSTQMKNFALQYFCIRVWAAPATLGIYAFKGWFLGMQNARIPMIISIVQNVLNIVFSLIFVFAFKMQIAGVAWGTLLAQYGGLLLAVFFFYKYYARLWHKLEWRQVFETSSLIKYFKVNSDIFLRTLCLVAVFTFFTIASSKMGALALAANTILLQFFTLFSYIMDGFAYAGESLVGKYIGAKNMEKTTLVIKQLFKWGLAFSVLFVAIYAVVGRQILFLFTDKTDVVNLANTYFLWVLAIPIVSFSAFLWDGILVGATASRLMRNSMFVATLIFFAIYFLLNTHFQNNALWIAFISYLGVRGLMQWLLWSRKKQCSRLF